mmetsp:Transcript_17082/g.22154  ORF Transcript_17082/g.22154 Transcript_17082/m.22154 type:complete len:484 (-) Transcript_17082:182-1633(-)
MVCGSFSLIFFLIAWCLSNEFIGMANTEPNPNRILGWISYFAIESYGSLAVAMFWAFANSTCSLELASCSYGLIIAFAQLGAFFGSTIATKADIFGVAKLYGVGALLTFLVVFLIYGYVELFPQHLPTPPSEKDISRSKKNPCSSMCTGLFLVMRYHYLQLVFGIGCLYEVVLTVLDYEMKVIGRARFGADQEGAVQFAKLMGHFGQTTNACSFIFSLFGFSFVVRSLGLRRTLRVFPILLLFVVSFSAAIPNLTVLFYSISLLKALTYSLNEPAMELLYIPTTDKIKFKAKAWIDVVGARSMKALGSAITHSARNNPALLVQYGSVPTLLVSLALFGISILAGRQFEDLSASGEIVGTEDDDNHFKVLPSMNTTQPSWYDDDDDNFNDDNIMHSSVPSSSPTTSIELTSSLNQNTTTQPSKPAIGWEPAMNKVIHSRTHETVKLPQRSQSDPSLGKLLDLPPPHLPPPPGGLRLAPKPDPFK